MGYDIYVQDLPRGIASVSEIPDDFVPKPLGLRSSVIGTILGIAPHANFADPAWGVILKDSIYHIEVNLGDAEELDSFAFHIAGGGEAIELVSNILSALGLRALDPQSESGLFQGAAN